MLYPLEERVTAQDAYTVVDKGKASFLLTLIEVNRSQPILLFCWPWRSVIKGIAHRFQQKRVARPVFPRAAEQLLHGKSRQIHGYFGDDHGVPLKPKDPA